MKSILSFVWVEDLPLATHFFLEMLATSRARIAEPQTSRRADKLAKDGVRWRSLAASHIRKMLSVAVGMAQYYSLLGRLDGMEPGVDLAVGRRRKVHDSLYIHCI